MNKFAEAATGVCLSSICQGLRHGLYHFGRASRRAAKAALTQDSPALSAIPAVPLERLLPPSPRDIYLRIQPETDGSPPIDQSLVLMALAVIHNPKVVLEIGTFKGHTTLLMARNLPDAIIHTIDLPTDFAPKDKDCSSTPKDDFHLIETRQVGRVFQTAAERTRIRQHFADTADWNFQAAAGATFFFIDGSHTYEYCKSDSEKCFNLCRGRGVFVWHDCDDGHPGVVKFITEWRSLGRSIVRVSGTPLAYWPAT